MADNLIVRSSVHQSLIVKSAVHPSHPWVFCVLSFDCKEYHHSCHSHGLNTCCVLPFDCNEYGTPVTLMSLLCVSLTLRCGTGGGATPVPPASTTPTTSTPSRQHPDSPHPPQPAQPHQLPPQPPQQLVATSPVSAVGESKSFVGVSLNPCCGGGVSQIFFIWCKFGGGCWSSVGVSWVVVVVGWLLIFTWCKFGGGGVVVDLHLV